MSTRRRAPRGALPLAAITAGVAALLAACSSGSTATPDWRPSPTNPAVEGPDVHIAPILPIPTGRDHGDPSAPRSQSSSPDPSSSSAKPAKQDPHVVATHLTTPVGLTMLPDNTALVGERSTGRIVRVQPVAGKPVPTVRTLHGLDFAGDGGLLDLAVSPTYDEDNLIYAYVTTAKDNRVVEFTLHGPVTPVFTGIPKGPRDNTGRIMFGADGDLYIGTGDAGKPQLAARKSSLAGKILRVTDIGRPASHNPTKGSAVYASGVRVVDGLCTSPTTAAIYETESGPDGLPDEINQIDRGSYYGWPTPSHGEQSAVATLPRKDSSPGGCAVLDNRLWVASLDGRSVVSTPLSGRPGSPALTQFTPILQGKYGRLRTVVAAADGALWMTTSNRDGHGDPVPTDERVIRYVPTSSQTGGSQA